MFIILVQNFCPLVTRTSGGFRLKPELSMFQAMSAHVKNIFMRMDFFAQSVNICLSGFHTGDHVHSEMQ